jgi:glyoxylase-like metal-dependent hydrolase (beta-lactamase superfamily II)
MQEITPNIFIENNSLGLVTGVIRTSAGSVLIDSPSRHDDARSWRSGTAKLVTGEPKFLINLDTNYDRIISAKGTECVIISHSYTVSIPRGKTSAAKIQDDSQSESELHDQQSTNPLRWIPPEIVFEDNLSIDLGGVRLELEHHPGSNLAGIWVILPQQRIVFVGDTVIVDQPPFLAYADLAAWQADLMLLASREYKGYQIISSRSGVIGTGQVREMEKLIATISNLMEPLIAKNADLDEYHRLIPKIMKHINSSPGGEELQINRLRWGLTTWYEQNQK